MISLVAQRLKHLPGMQETRVWFLGWEDPLEKEMATHSSILAWRIPWTEEPGRFLVHGGRKSQPWLSNYTTTTTHLCYLEVPRCYTHALPWATGKVIEILLSLLCHQNLLDKVSPSQLSLLQGKGGQSLCLRSWPTTQWAVGEETITFALTTHEG